MLTSFSTALSALAAHSTAIDVVGNNLANLNTPGFKASVIAFNDLVTQSLGLGDTQVGFGVGRPKTIRQFSQGAIQTTSGPLDVAIQGDGFFVVRDEAGAVNYTRGGNLQVNNNGILTTATGFKVQGWSQTEGTQAVDTNAPISNIVVPVGTLKAPVATTEVSVDLNLNASSTAGPPPDSFSTSIEAIDSLGASHILTIALSKTANTNEWAYSISIPDADLATAFTPVTGTLQFDSSGKLATPNAAAVPTAIPIAGFKNGAADMSIDWTLYEGTRARLTQFTQLTAVSALSQNGSSTASLIRVGISDAGRIMAQYSNGQQVMVGQLAMATIRNAESLVAVGNNNYQLSGRSALPAVGEPGTGGRGSVLGGAIESSTVDIAHEFTNLIVFQRGYQANARIVTTVDELSQETINLKR